jgi:hypothetical protein
LQSSSRGGGLLSAEFVWVYRGQPVSMPMQNLPANDAPSTQQKQDERSIVWMKYYQEVSTICHVSINVSTFFSKLRLSMYGYDAIQADNKKVTQWLTVQQRPVMTAAKRLQSFR